MRRYYPIIIALSFVTLFFTLASIYPYHMDADVATQIKPVQQWLRGESKLFYEVAIADPKDLSQTVRTWITWWTPGIAALFAPLLAIGIPIGVAGRLLSYGLSISGCLGWLAIAEVMGATMSVRLALAFTLPLYSISNSTTYSALGISSGDILPFGIMPWVHLYVLFLTANIKLKSLQFLLLHSVGAGLLLGLIYWLKYSAFLGSIGLLCYISLNFLLIQRQVSFFKRLTVLTTTATVCLTTVKSLTSLNQTLHSLSALELYTQVLNNTIFTQPLAMILAALGGLGLLLFQIGDLMVYLLYFNPLLPIRTAENIMMRHSLLLASGIPFTLVIGWIGWQARRLFSPENLLFATCILLVPFSGLLYLSVKSGFNFIAQAYLDVNRHTVGTSPILQILALSVMFSLIPRSSLGLSLNSLHIQLKQYADSLPNRSSVALVALIASVIIISSSFIGAFFIKNGVVERFNKPYLATTNHLYTPELSSQNTQKVTQQIDSLITSPQDVVVLAISQESYPSIWLEINHRLVPTLGTSMVPVYPHYLQEPLTSYSTSHNLRVILVASKYRIQTLHQLDSLKNQFPQAQQWVEVPTDNDVTISLWYADLKA